MSRRAIEAARANRDTLSDSLVPYIAQLRERYNFAGKKAAWAAVASDKTSKYAAAIAAMHPACPKTDFTNADDVKAFGEFVVQIREAAKHPSSAHPIDGFIERVALTRDGQHLVVSHQGHDHGEELVSVLDASTGSLKKEIRCTETEECALLCVRPDGSPDVYLCLDPDGDDGDLPAAAYDPVTGSPKAPELMLPWSRNLIWHLTADRVTGGMRIWDPKDGKAVDPAESPDSVASALSDCEWIRYVEVFEGDNQLKSCHAEWAQGQVCQFSDGGLFREALDDKDWYELATGKKVAASADGDSGVTFTVHMPGASNVNSLEIGEEQDTDPDMVIFSAPANGDPQESTGNDPAGPPGKAEPDVGETKHGDLVAKADGRTLTVSGGGVNWTRSDLMANKATVTFTGLKFINGGKHLVTVSGVPKRLCINLLDAQTGKLVAKVRHFPLRSILSGDSKTRRAVLAGSRDGLKCDKVGTTPVIQVAFDGFGDHQYQVSENLSHFLLKADSGHIHFRDAKTLQTTKALDVTERLVQVSEPLVITRTADNVEAPDDARLFIYNFATGERLAAVCPDYVDKGEYASPQDPGFIGAFLTETYVAVSFYHSVQLFRRSANGGEKPIHVFPFEEEGEGFDCVVAGCNTKFATRGARDNAVCIYDVTDAGKVTLARTFSGTPLDLGGTDLGGEEEEEEVMEG